MTETITKPTPAEIRESSKVRKLITALPVICGCENAQSLVERFGDLFDHEMKGGTAFDCQHADIAIPGNRLSMVNPGRYNPEDFEKANIGFSRLVLAEFSTYFKQGKIDADKWEEVMAEFSIDGLTNDPEIDAILPYQEAVTMSYWW